MPNSFILECYVHSGVLARTIIDHPEGHTSEECYHSLVADYYCTDEHRRELSASSDLAFAYKIVETTVQFDRLSTVLTEKGVFDGIREGYLGEVVLDCSIFL